MYAKLFTSIYQGTLRGNSHGLLVFTNLLAHADSASQVDIHPKAIAEEVGLTLEQVRAALDLLESPDPESRTPDEEGRRIIRLDEHRAWGWRIVNHAKYRAIRNEDDRREQNRLAQQRWRERNQSKPRKPESAHTEADTEADALKDLEPTALVIKDDSYRVPNCPYDELLSLYHGILPMLSKVRVMTNIRMKHAQARWKQVCSDAKIEKQEALDWFKWYFERVSESKFLTGKTPGRDGRVWMADFEWLMNGSNFAKVIEGNYHR